ncbi:MAG TPA: hypothetical protein PLV41_07605 [Miltoncostaeales bacterium]|nr:hypothetical protein [Miltoncostaeales bacterium]
MRRSRRRVLGIVAVVLSVVAFWAPSFVAARYTNDVVRSDVAGHPIRGWQFMADAVRSSRKAAAGTEGNARGIAARHWWLSRVQVDSLELVYVEQPFMTIPVPTGGLRRPVDERTVHTNARFIWFVRGHIGARPRQIVGLINFQTGRVVWDILRTRPAGAR